MRITTAGRKRSAPITQRNSSELWVGGTREREAIEKAAAEFKVAGEKPAWYGERKQQKASDDALGIALNLHAARFHGDKMLWLREHAIDWSGCEKLRWAV